MSDLSSLMQYAPTVAAGFMGSNQAQQEQSTALEQMKLKQLMAQLDAEEQRKQQAQPGLLQHQQLLNQELQTKMPGMQAQADSLGLARDVTRATQPGNIAAENFKNNNSIRDAVIQRLGPMSEDLRQVPAVGRLAELDSQLKQMGVPDSNRQAMLEGFSKVPAEKLPDYMKTISEKALRNTPAYAQTMDHEALQQSGATERARIMATSRDYAADTRAANAGKKALDPDDIRGQLIAATKGKPASTQLASYQTAIIRAHAIGDEKLLNELMAEAAALKAQVDSDPNRGPRPGTPDLPALSNGKVPVNQPSPVPLVDPRGQAAPAAAPAQASGAKDIRSLVESKGERFEPDRYDYRINPATGAIQKKPKGK